MTFWEQLVRRPQNLWLRKAVFQVHLWTGIGVGLYILVSSISGSAIVFRNELYKNLGQGPVIVSAVGPRLTETALKDAARRAYPDYVVTFVWQSKSPNHAIEIWMEHNGKKKQRLFDPYTGKDLGDSVPRSIRLLAWLGDLHTNLLGGDTGRIVNGVGAGFVTLLTLTGAMLWWPGSRNWRRSLVIHPKAGWKRFNWDLHNVVGFWTFAFVFMWGATGVYVVFPTPFQRAINRIAPLDYYRVNLDADSAPAPPSVSAKPAPRAKFVWTDQSNLPPRRRFRPHFSTGDKIVRWLTYLHFGNFAGWKVKAVWTALGLAPVFLFFTGALMWWNRVLSPDRSS
jgi:uncharacterized iron-regulated membrane protein